MLSVIKKYFPTLSPGQEEQLEALGTLYPEWNAKINVISRKDIGNLYVNHVLHSLAIGKFLSPVAGTTFLDVGTGGGFPGIPMAIMYPECRFHLIDRVGKKLTVVKDITSKLGLVNVTTQHGDLGECHEKFDYVVSRAAMEMPLLYKIAAGNVARKMPRNAWPNGIIALKGGDLEAELARLRVDYIEENLDKWFSEPYFETKKLIFIPI